MRNQQIRDPHLPASCAQQSSAEPGPIHRGAKDFQEPGPIASCAEGKEPVRIGEEVKPSERHNDEVEFVLEWKEETGDDVDFHDTVVVR